jgi:hypothetical protein
MVARLPHNSSDCATTRAEAPPDGVEVSVWEFRRKGFSRKYRKYCARVKMSWNKKQTCHFSKNPYQRPRLCIKSLFNLFISRDVTGSSAEATGTNVEATGVGRTMEPAGPADGNNKKTNRFAICFFLLVVLFKLGTALSDVRTHVRTYVRTYVRT